jgi:hypothetical protein
VTGFEYTLETYVGLRDPIRYVFNNASSVTLLANFPIPKFSGRVQTTAWTSTTNSNLGSSTMAANIDLNRIPGKPGDPYRGQAVLHPEGQGPQHKIKLPAIPVRTNFDGNAMYLRVS